MQGILVLCLLLFAGARLSGGIYPCGNVSESMIRGRALCMNIGRGVAPHDGWGSFALVLKDDGTYDVHAAPGIAARSGKWTASTFQTDGSTDFYLTVRLSGFTQERTCRLSLFPFSTFEGELGCDYEMEFEPRVEGSFQQGSYRVVDAPGECLSAGPWFFQSPPSNSVVSLGGTLNLEALCSGASGFTYQWQRDGLPLPEARGASLVRANVDFSDGGNYTLIATGAGQSITSRPVRVQVNRPVPPSLIRQPVSIEQNAGSTAWLDVIAAGDPPLRFQWLKDGVALVGQQGRTLRLESLREQNSGDYFVLVSSPLGSVVSQPAKLTVSPRSSPQILEQPQDVRLLVPGYAQFGVRVAGPGPFVYKWFRHSSVLGEGMATSEGPTSNSTSTLSLFVPSQGEVDKAVHVEVSNESGGVESRAARLIPAHLQSPGQPDRMYSQQELIEGIQTLLPLAGGAVLGVAGHRLLRLDSAGAVRELVSLDHPPAALQVQPDGRILVASLSGGGAWLRRFSALGETDKSFRPDRRLSGNAAGLAWLPNWKILSFGSFSSSMSTAKPLRLVQLALNGDWDEKFRPAFLNKAGTSEGVEIRRVVTQADGRFLVAGFFHQVDGEARAHLVRFLPNGQVDPSFVPDEVSPGPIWDVVLTAADSMTIRGPFLRVGDTARGTLARLTSGGRLDPVFNATSLFAGSPTASVENQPMLGLPDGRLILASSATRGIVRMNRDGSRDRGFFHADTTNRIDCLALDSLQGVWVAGDFSNLHGHTTRSVARLYLHSPETTAARLPMILEPLQIRRSGSGVVGVYFSGDTLEFSTRPGGTPTPVCEWLRDGAPIRQWGLQTVNAWDGLARITVPGLRVEDSGEYRVVARNLAGAVTSAPVRLDVVSEPFVVLRQPQGVSRAIGSQASLTVSVAARRPLEFQWEREGKLLPGQTNQTLLFLSLQSSDAGEYQVQIQALGATNAPLVSQSAVVEVIVPTSGDRGSAGGIDLMPLDSLMLVRGVSKFRFKAELELFYSVESKPAAGDGDWVSVVRVNGDGKDHEVVVGKAGSLGFYRLVLVPPTK